MLPQVDAIMQEGYTQVPNRFLDEIAPDLSASELRVMLYIFRHTLGWQKLSDTISYNQFINGIHTHDGRRLDRGAGVCRRSLVPALAGLERRGLITRYQNAYRPATIKLESAAISGAFPTAGNPNQSPPELLPASCTPIPAKPGLQVQDLPLPADFAAQDLHPTKELINQNKEDRAAAVLLITKSIPGINAKEAGKLVVIATSNNRDLTYIRRLVDYITTNPAIHTPAAAFTALIKGNQDRTPLTTTGANQRRSNWPASASTGQARTTRQGQGPIDPAKYGPGGKYAYLLTPYENGSTQHYD
jgi:DNA-binding MarR family transcriptional regulator